MKIVACIRLLNLKHESVHTYKQLPHTHFLSSAKKIVSNVVSGKLIFSSEIFQKPEQNKIDLVYFVLIQVTSLELWNC